MDRETLIKTTKIDDLWRKEGKYYTTATDEENPGDLKVSFKYASLNDFKEITVLARQKGDKLEPYEKGSVKILKIKEGNKSIDDIFEELQKEDSRGGYIGLIIIILIIGVFVNFI